MELKKSSVKNPSERVVSGGSASKRVDQEVYRMAREIRKFVTANGGAEFVWKKLTDEAEIEKARKALNSPTAMRKYEKNGGYSNELAQLYWILAGRQLLECSAYVNDDNEIVVRVDHDFAKVYKEEGDLKEQRMWLEAMGNQRAHLIAKEGKMLLAAMNPTLYKEMAKKLGWK